MNSEISKQVEQIKREWDEMTAQGQRVSAVFGELAAAAEQMQRAAIESISLSDAFERIRLELLKSNEPGSYYHLWQCNIAMCMVDAAIQTLPPGISKVHDFYPASVKAATNFLNILCLHGSDQSLKKHSK